MILIIGGNSQGKHRYVQEKFCLSDADFSDSIAGAESKKCLDRLHEAVKYLLEQEIDPADAVQDLLRKNQNIIIICDEIGCGVVPLDPKERNWRETVGRICCDLAKAAVRVERVFCGIPTVLKEK